MVLRQSLRWSNLALPVGLAVVGLTWAVRESSGFGWVALGQMILVVPWLAPLLLPVVFYVTRHRASSDLPLALFLACASMMVFLSGFTLDVGDGRGECFIGSCVSEGGDPWWWQSELAWSSPWIALFCAGSGFVMLLLASGRSLILRRRSPSPWERPRNPTDASVG